MAITEIPITREVLFHNSNRKVLVPIATVYIHESRTYVRILVQNYKALNGTYTGSLRKRVVAVIDLVTGITTHVEKCVDEDV
jgi:hypothetical protein